MGADRRGDDPEAAGRRGGRTRRVHLSMRRHLLLLALLAVAPACRHAPPEDARDYAQRLADDRAAKDELFRRGNDPIPDARKAELLPLGYFPIDPDYDVPASLEPSDDSTILEMQT